MAQIETPLPEPLARLERRLATLRSMQAQGRLSPAQYQEEIQRLTATDEHGRTWWLAGDAGAWHRWDGQAWVAGNPAGGGPSASKSAAGRSARAPQVTRKLRLFASIGCAALVVVCTVTAGALVLGDFAEYQALPKIAEGVQVDVVVGAPLPLSNDQQRVRAERGDPEAFLLLFYEEPLEDGSTGDVRMETWSYYTGGVEYIFINGNLEAQAAIEAGIGELAAAPYQPEQFQAYMSLEEVLAAAGLNSFLLVPLERELVVGGEVYYADQFTFGLQDGELRYLEALALEVEG
jgi:hypothetical protein